MNEPTAPDLQRRNAADFPGFVRRMALPLLTGLTLLAAGGPLWRAQQKAEPPTVAAAVLSPSPQQSAP